ncbi:PRTRC system ThiF family protein [Niabella sp. CJ426]|uniref:PRTRC system ThiF family protein n=1 Tax=Niabella sp. CJ426 TaxID=3393740 RepID=UPI003D087577
MKTSKLKVHFTDNELLQPTNPLTVNLIGGGGTGSKVLTCLVEMNHSLIMLGHPGLDVRLWDDDIVTNANLGRQRFAESETGMNKAVALINRANRWAGTNWKAETRKFGIATLKQSGENVAANIYITCVDNVATRFEMAEFLKIPRPRYSYDQPLYWMDYGNSRYTGQVILSTVGKIQQPKSRKYEPVANLPFITDEYPDLLKQSETKDDTPSCSLAQALEQQDLYINGALAQLGSSLLWGMFRNGLTEHRGFFLNLKEFRSKAIPIG